MQNKKNTVHISALTPEELKSQQLLLEDYKETFKTYPKGTLIIQEKKGIPQLYLRYRDGSKIRDKHIGRDDSDISLELKQLIKQRDSLEKKINDIQKKLKENKRLHRS